jgi:hypothetical protein
MGAGMGVLECLITGTGDLVENVAKLRVGKIAKLVTLSRERKLKLLEAEARAPGRELALLSEIRTGPLY